MTGDSHCLPEMCLGDRRGGPQWWRGLGLCTQGARWRGWALLGEGAR